MTSLDGTGKKIASKYGKNVVKVAKEVDRLQRISTGLLSLDKVTGGGIPKGRITEIYGNWGSSKSLLLLSIIAEAQKQDGKAVYIDLERTFDKDWAELNGVDLDNLIIATPTYGEEAYDILCMYLESEEVSVIGLDSIAQAVPKAELEGGIEDANIGLAARLNAKMMRRLTSILGNTAVILINQTRANVNTGPFQGSSTTTSGGRAIPFYASLRLNLARIGWVKSANEKIGGRFRARIDKCKIKGARYHGVAEFEVDFERGLDKAKDILTYAIHEGWVEKAASWYTLYDVETGEELEKVQGELAAKEYMLENDLVDAWGEKLLNED